MASIPPALTNGFHHVAYRCKDAKETVAFYQKTLGMDFQLAIAEDHVPSTGAYDPYMHIFMDAGNGNVLAFFELPEQPELDDWSFGGYSMREAKPLYTKDAVLSIWQDTFQELHAWGGICMMVMHPQVTGRPMRLATLREFIHLTRKLPDVWTTTCREVAEAFVAQEN